MTSTQRPAGPASAAGHRRRRRLATTATVTALLLTGGGYTAACAIAPLPQLEIEYALGFADRVELAPDAAAAQAVVDARPLPTALGWGHDDEVWSNTEEAVPLASISKLVTVLVCQEAEPLEPGAQGPIYTWTDEDVQRQADLLAVDGVAFPIPAGTEVPLRDMLEFIFLPSANDFAVAYAHSVFGDNETFLAAVDDWAERHGIGSLEFVEPSGMDEGNRATPADVIRIARLVLENPTLTEFTGMQTADMSAYGAGVIENTNPLLGVLPDIIGVKTGRSSSAGFNLVAAQRVDEHGRELVKISVTMARASLEERARSGRELLADMDALPQQVETLAAGVEVGTVTTWQGETVPLTAERGSEALLVPGEEAVRIAELSITGATPAGASVGRLSVDSPAGADEVPVLVQAEVEEPDLWWRLTHPGALFGG